MSAAWQSGSAMLPRLRPPEALDWTAALAGPLLMMLVVNLWGGGGGGDGGHRLAAHAAGSRPDREVTNVAAMATRDYFTARQDKNPLMALVHVTSASAMLSAARRIASDEQLSIALDTDVRGVASDIDELQRQITARMAKSRRPATRPAA